MKPQKPAGDDVAPDFLARKPFAEEPSLEFLRTARNLIDHDLEVNYHLIKDDFFDAMKEIALEGDEEKIREADKAVREIFDNEPRKLAAWDELMSRYEFMQETLE